MTRSLAGLFSKGTSPRSAPGELLARANASRYLSGDPLKSPAKPLCGDVEPDAAPMRTPGRPLSPAESADMERHFGRDFADVRVHTDAPEPQRLGARAFAMGNHVAVAPGENLATPSGRALLAHELTHTMETRRGGGTSLQLESKKGEGGLGSAPPEEKFDVSGERAPENAAVLFPFDSASLSAKATKALDKLARQYTEAVTVRIHAYASAEGNGDYNLNLSAHRAVEVKRYLESKLPAKSKVLLVAHGETSAFGAAENNRRAGIAVSKGVEDAPTTKKGEGDNEWAIDPSNSEAHLADRFTLFPRLQPHLFLDDNLLGPRPLSSPQIQLVPPYQLNPLLPRIGANDVDWFAMQQSFRSRGVTLDTQWGDSIQSHFLYSYHWFRGFLSHDLAVKGANLATSFVVDDSLARFAPNAIDRSNQEFKLHYPDEKHLVIPLSSDSLYGIYRFLGGKNKDQYMFRF